MRSGNDNLAIRSDRPRIDLAGETDEHLQTHDHHRQPPWIEMTWTQYFMAMATLVSSRSEDPSTKVGCVIVGPDNEVRSTGYNGMPRGVKVTPARLERPAKYLHFSHAEISAIGNAARHGVALKGCTVYVSHSPCAGCARALIQSGIRRVVFGPGTTSMPAEEFEAAAAMFKEAGVEMEAA